MQEIWKDIEGYEGLYQVSDKGNVMRLETKIDAPYMKDSGYRTIKQTILKPQNRNKYKCVRLSKDGKIKSHNIHRLVAAAFIPNTNNYPFVMHLDNDRHNNSANNLQWGTAQMNSKHAVETGVWNNQYTI